MSESAVSGRIESLYSAKGKTAVITGASQGIGRATAIAFAEAGADVVLCGRNAAELHRTAERIQQTGQRAEVVLCDVRRVQEIQAMASYLSDRFSRIDILVNNAGIDIPQMATDVTEDAWDSILETNLKGMFFCSQSVGRLMIRQGGGQIINLASELSYVATPMSSVYAISKGGVVQLTKALAVEWAPYGVRVNAVAPTLIQTPMTEMLFAANPALLHDSVARIPFKRMGRPEEVAAAIVFLASDAAKFITGETLLVDGGRLAW
ncbi:MAG: SDR family oxidoreductase [Alicyclobacillus sp.]|nr:SDR family oxidoreductase [Alicyclobacillus sp.]